tara:strand:- start:6489 stop:7355 length:867 start_codon:yes stop_codon:yes gene_type:complete
MTTYTTPTLRTRTQLIEGIEHRQRNRGNRRWSDGEIARALNDSLLTWSGRVSIPYVYTITAGWVAGTYEYALPSYIPGKMVPQRRVQTPYVNSDGSTTTYVWADVLGWGLEADGSGGQLLRTEFDEGLAGTTNSARILYWAAPGQLPEEDALPTLNANITSSETSLVLSAVYDVAAIGYVKIGSEWLQYAGVTDDGSNTTLSNLVRGTAASHTQGDEIDFGVGVPDVRLFSQLQQQTIANLHALTLTDAPGQETEHHKWQMQWRQQMADAFWASWAPRAPMMKLSRRA